MASSILINHLSRGSYLATLYLEMSIFSDSGRRECVDQPAAVSTTRTVEHPVLLTSLSVETLSGEARLPFPVQRQVYSE